ADQPSDAEWLLGELWSASYTPAGSRAASAEELRARLDNELDAVLVVSPHARLDVPRALQIVREQAPDVPAIVVSTVDCVDAAGDALKQGAAAYLSARRLDRCGPAVARAIALRQQRAAEGDATAALRASEARYRAIAELTTDYAYALAVGDEGALILDWV